MAGGVRSRRKVRVSDAHGHQENLRSEPLQSVASLTCGDVAAATCLALVAFTVYTEGGRPMLDITNDCIPNMFTPIALLRQQTFTFDEMTFPFFYRWKLSEGGKEKGQLDFRRFDEVPKQTGNDMTAGDLFDNGYISLFDIGHNARSYNVVSSLQGGLVSTFGPGVGLLFTPVVAAATASGMYNLTELADPNSFEQLATLAHFTASGCVAASVAFVFLTLRVSSVDRDSSFLAALAYSFASCVWSISARGLWQHGPNSMFTSLAMLSMAQGHHAKKNLHYGVAGICLGAAVLCRPAALAWPVCVGAHLVWKGEWHRLVCFIVGGVPMALFLGVYNYNHFGSLVTTGQTIASLAIVEVKGADGLWTSPVILGLSTLLFSPARGLLFYSPWLLSCSLLHTSPSAVERLAWATPFLMAVGVQLVVAAKFYDHWGGWCFGYRPVVDVAPVLAVACGATFPVIRKWRVLKMILGATLCWSVGVQVIGACAYNPIDWNGRFGIAWVVNGELKEALYCSYDFGNNVAPPEQPLLQNAMERWGNPTEDRCTRLNIDEIRYRARLWDIVENPIGYFAANFWASRTAMLTGNHHDVGLNLIGRVRSHGYRDCSRGLCRPDPKLRQAIFDKYPTLTKSNRTLGR